jgi:hypothetical protein
LRIFATRKQKHLFTFPPKKAMKGTFQTGKADKHKINGTAVEITEITSDTATVKLPNGRKAHLPVKTLVSFEGDLTFNADGTVDAVEAEEAETAETEE